MLSQWPRGLLHFLNKVRVSAHLGRVVGSQAGHAGQAGRTGAGSGVGRARKDPRGRRTLDEAIADDVGCSGIDTTRVDRPRTGRVD